MLKKIWWAVAVAGVMTAAGCGGGGGDDEPDVCNGDGRCNGDETENNCPEDCEVEDCGNNVCDAGETSQNCAQDCRPCGNGVCDAGETPQTCASDCMAPVACNNNGVCEATEQYATCSTDCASKLRTQNSSSYTIFYLYLKRCTEAAWSPDQLGAQVISPGQAFTLNGIPPGCWNFKANDSGFAHQWTSSAGVNLTPGGTYTWTLTN
jgi:hypothetical protein